MAKIDISIDTSDKKVSVKLDGKAVKDVSNIWISTTEGGYFGLEITQFEDIDDSTRKVTRLVASKDDETWQEDSTVDHKGLAEVLLQREV